MDLTLLIYELTSDFPKHELYGLTSQMRRASVSIASNVAEGSARRRRRDFRQFVIMARGSNFELQTQLILAMRLRYSSETKLQHAETMALDIGRMLNGLSNYLKQKQATDAAPAT